MSYSPVPELNLLKAFQDENGFGEYADGFGLTDYDDKSGLSAGWSDDNDFLAGLIPFATATGGGSFYALWRVDDRADLATLPVVVFGDEGGQHVVARDLPDLFRLLTFDAEPMIDWDEVTFYRAADHEHRPAHAAYVTWLGTQFGLAPTDDPDTIVSKARGEFGPRFTEWADRYLPG
ncbi:hypothetical protein JIG36_49260 [Actinoplanes sp. LDG1-06]|uniref:Knr4/Smi1-like domain-containing protein n=1 Tax=Paractinoplanes ovalisporus TaxID=2810368 RepID=A0ABS2AWB8_9ACTN|nr:hypothetical protein [Actinoplanes ovalisporus]MBM2623511.1 hypothetical protein [Actinoplanes ovalisporus]